MHGLLHNEVSIFLTNSRASARSFGLRAPVLLTAAWALLIVVLTLRPDPGAIEAVGRTPWWCLSCGEAGTADLLLNLVLFAPLGWGLARCGLRRGSAILAALGTTILIEVAQGLALPGRDAALGDVVANTLGAAAGFLAARLLMAGPPTWLAPITLLGFAGQLLVSWWFWSPATEAASREVRLAPVLAGRPIYDGSVAMVALRGAMLHGEESSGAGSPATAIATAFTWTSVDSGRATPLVRIEDGRGWPLATVDRLGDRVILAVRTVAGALQFRDPSWAITLDRIAIGTTVDVTLALRPGSAELAAAWEGGTRSRTVREGPQHGWVFLNPYAPGVGDRGWQGWTLGWLAAWGLLLGWSARTRRRLPWWGAAAVTVFLACCAAAGAPAQPGEIVALAAGWLLAVSSGRSRRSPAGA